MKVLVVTNMYPSSQNKFAGIFVKKVSDGFLQRGADISIWSLSSKGSKLWRYFKFYSLYLLRLVRFRPEVVHCHFVSHCGLLGILSKMIFGSRLVANVHGSDVFNSLNSRGKYYLVSKVFTQSDLIIVPSLYMKNVILENFRIEHRNIYISPSGGVVPTLENQVSIKSIGLKVGYVGRIDKKKGIYDIVSLANRLPEMKFAIAGGYLTNTVKTPNNIDFLGQLDGSDLASFYNSIDILIFPSYYPESLGLTPLEAMTHGKPVLATNVGAVKEYVKPGVNGFLVEPGDLDAMEQILERYNLMSQNEYAEFSEQCFATSKLFNRDKVIDDLYTKVLDVCKSNTC